MPFEDMSKLLHETSLARVDPADGVPKKNHTHRTEIQQVVAHCLAVGGVSLRQVHDMNKAPNKIAKGVCTAIRQALGATDKHLFPDFKALVPKAKVFSQFTGSKYCQHDFKTRVPVL